MHRATAPSWVRDWSEMQKTLNRILDRKLTAVAVQVRAGAAAPQIDALLEGIEEGIDAQVDGLRKIAPLSDSDADVWKRLEAGAKISVLPSQIAETLEGLDGYAVVEATGVGW